MTIKNFIETTNLDRSFVIGFYGGGNYGDELLMEVLANLLYKNGRIDIDFLYQTPNTFQIFHKDFGYGLVPSGNKPGIIKAVFKAKNIVVGGGGLWGLDVNPNILLLSAMLFFARYILRKKVYLLGVGYYSSTSKIGHLSAFLAGKAANHIFARDPETRHNFGRLNKQVHIDSDLAWHLKDLDLTDYTSDTQELQIRLPVGTSQTLFIALRRFRHKYQNNFTNLVAELLANNTDKPIIVAIMEPRTVDPEGYELIKSWQRTYKNVHVIDFTFNPLALFLFFREHQKQLVMIAPQFHALITAHLNNVKFLPLVYDNKSRELLASLGFNQQVHINELKYKELASFVGAQSQ